MWYSCRNNAVLGNRTDLFGCYVVGIMLCSDGRVSLWYAGMDGGDEQAVYCLLEVLSCGLFCHSIVIYLSKGIIILSFIDPIREGLRKLFESLWKFEIQYFRWLVIIGLPLHIHAVSQAPWQLPLGPSYAVWETAWDIELAAIFDCFPSSFESTWVSVGAFTMLS